MRCLSCNVALSDEESTRKDSSGNFIDMCNNCCNESGIFYTVREDLLGVIDGSIEESSMSSMQGDGEG